MNGGKELGEILYECSKQNNKVIDWWKQHKDDDIFITDDGNKLRQHLGAMMKQEALAMMQLGKIELLDALKHPDIFISEETYNAFKEAMKITEES